MNKSSLNSSYCPNVDEELGKIAIEEVAEDMEDILAHFNTLNLKLLDKKYKELADKVRYFKEDEKGVAAMCKVMEDMRNESARKA